MSDKKGALSIFAQGTVDGLGAFLSRVCLPASEEFGLLLKERVSFWRAKNAINIVKKFKNKLQEIEGSENFHAHPRLVTIALETGSFSDDTKIQDMWAGLLATACDKTGKDESNLLFMNILTQINSTEAILLNYLCVNAKKTVSESELIWGEEMELTPYKIEKLTGISDIHRMDRELDHLAALDLIAGGFGTKEKIAKVSPRALGLHMYVSCQGSKLSPLEYFCVNQKDNPYKCPYNDIIDLDEG